MSPVVIADASCLILLQNIGALDILRQLFGQILVMEVVAEEYGLPLPSWLQATVVQDPRRAQLLALTLDLGEASTIALALEQPNSLLIIDERRGRNVAQQLQLNITGTLGILLRAKQEGHLVALRPLLEAIATTNFRLSATLIQTVLKKAGE